MPMKRVPKGASKKTRSKIVSNNIDEFHSGARFKKLVAKFGKAKAQRVSIAAGFSAARRSRMGKKRKY